MDTPLRHAPATHRNRAPIFDVLARILPKAGLVLEIASGTGEHAAFMGPRLGDSLRWQPSDRDPAFLADIDGHAAAADCARVLPAVLLDVESADWPLDAADAVLCSNMIHIAPFSAAEGLFQGASRLLPAGAPLILYGPFKRFGAHTAPSNASFDEGLMSRDPRWGVRCLDSEIGPLAARTGFVLSEIVPMPANNHTVVFRKG